ncbi:MAG: alpha-amylase family glycosyl hydrolase [Myxococcota bacterium]
MYIKSFLFLIFSVSLYANAWWEGKVVYQVYLRSFQDSNNDGIGDIPGLISRLDYLQSLGVDALWLSPIHKSPDYDFGYDVKGYFSIHPALGTHQDFQQLTLQANKRGIKIMMDLVINHTSDQHPWFLASKSSKSNPKRNWYIWSDGKGNQPPNNWRSRLDESSWVYDESSNQYYQHSFFKEQPDLNLRNPEVQKEIEKIMHFWLERGVSGFRLDLANYYMKDAGLRDNPATNSWSKWFQSSVYAYMGQEHLYDKNHPDLANFYRKLRTIADNHNALLLGEVDVDDGEQAIYAARSVSNQTKGTGLHLSLHRDFISNKFSAEGLENIITEHEALMPRDIPMVVTFNNHDHQRFSTTHTAAETRLAALFTLTSKGFPVLYYGEEIGLKDAYVPQALGKDPLPRIMWKPAYFAQIGRDGCRTPMHWDNTAYAGFSKVEPWITFDKEGAVSVEEQEQDAKSLLNFYKKLISLRKQHVALAKGKQTLYKTGIKNLLIFKREYKDQTIWVAMNFSPANWISLNTQITPENILASTHPQTTNLTELGPMQAVITTKIPSPTL